MPALGGVTSFLFPPTSRQQPYRSLCLLGPGCLPERLGLGSHGRRLACGAAALAVVGLPVGAGLANALPHGSVEAQLAAEAGIACTVPFLVYSFRFLNNYHRFEARWRSQSGSTDTDSLRP